MASEIFGSAGSVVARLALDTGATHTAVNSSLLLRLGYHPLASPNRVQVTTGSGVEYVPIVKISQLHALRNERSDFDVMAHTFPTSATVDGVLGLDFLRGHILTVDFRGGQISLE